MGSAFATVLHHGEAIPAVLHGDKLTPLSLLTEPEVPVPSSVLDAIGSWDRWCAISARLDDATTDCSWWIPASSASFLPPVPDPPTIFCAGGNYADHIVEMTGHPPDKANTEPYHFVAARGALLGHRHTVRRPAATAQLDWEVELAVVMGTRADNVSVGDALDHVAGYTVANDLSLRDLAMRPDTPFGVDWLRSKCFAGCLPMGPAIVPRAQVPDPQDLRISLTVNGELMQDSSTSEMIFGVAEQIAYLSAIAPLVPGDVICTGTPAGVGIARNRFLEPGDVTVAAVEGVGELVTTVS